MERCLETRGVSLDLSHTRHRADGLTTFDPEVDCECSMVAATSDRTPFRIRDTRVSLNRVKGIRT